MRSRSSARSQPTINLARINMCSCRRLPMISRMAPPNRNHRWPRMTSIQLNRSFWCWTTRKPGRSIMRRMVDHSRRSPMITTAIIIWARINTRDRQRCRSCQRPHIFSAHRRSDHQRCSIHRHRAMARRERVALGRRPATSRERLHTVRMQLKPPPVRCWWRGHRYRTTPRRQRVHRPPAMCLARPHQSDRQAQRETSTNYHPRRVTPPAAAAPKNHCAQRNHPAIKRSPRSHCRLAM